jgi:hypothetical protein
MMVALMPGDAERYAGRAVSSFSIRDQEESLHRIVKPQKEKADSKNSRKLQGQQ